MTLVEQLLEELPSPNNLPDPVDEDVDAVGVGDTLMPSLGQEDLPDHLRTSQQAETNGHTPTGIPQMDGVPRRAESLEPEASAGHLAEYQAARINQLMDDLQGGSGTSSNLNRIRDLAEDMGVDFDEEMDFDDGEIDEDDFDEDDEDDEDDMDDEGLGLEDMDLDMVDGVEEPLSSEGDFGNVEMILPRRSFKGARNMETVKDCNFLGFRSEKICSGSDDGNFFVWDKETGKLEGIWEGDGSVVNGKFLSMFSVTTCREQSVHAKPSHRATSDFAPHRCQWYRRYCQGELTCITASNK